MLAVSIERERLDADVLIVGAGPAGLACALRLAQLAAADREAGRTPAVLPENVYVLEKGREVGAHQLSGAILDPRGLAKLIAAGVRHHGSSFIDVLQTCPTYNDLYTAEWYNHSQAGGPRLYRLAETGYDGKVKDPAAGGEAPPEYPREVTIRVASSGWLSEADFAALVADEIPANVAWELHVGDRQLWPVPVAAAAVGTAAAPAAAGGEVPE